MPAISSQRRKGPRSEDPELKGRRANTRARVLLTAAAEALSGHVQVTLQEVSLAGARLSGTRLPAAGKEVMLSCAGVEMFGTVVWAREGQCGIVFDQPLSVRDLRAVREVSAAYERGGLTPDERQAAADWLNGVAR